MATAIRKLDPQQEGTLKPFLRWAGSKRKLLSKIQPYWKPSFARYVEPFMGSACLFFAINPKRALLNDINADLVGTFLSIRDDPQSVFDQLRKIPLGKRSYYRVRKQTELQNEAERSARFLFLNRFCFNGIYRTNGKGEFNVPFAREGTGNLPTMLDLMEWSRILKKTCIRSEDFEETLDRTRKGDFVYLDPPYALDNRRIFRQYGPQTFGLNDLDRLSKALRRINRRGVRFVLSYAYCTEALDYFGEWRMRKVFTQRNVAGFSRHRRKAAEILVSN
ncbi:MAG: Dam family site-specific DNA-(adenine-N6)-methyltransferase [Verrucomicrobia bacterium]|nr:Dam family site-specific DNA-(adenine-N6)-methyltransferase [Verrucomicrobiota bacterium]